MLNAHLTSSVLEECTLHGEGNHPLNRQLKAPHIGADKEYEMTSDVREDVPLACSLTVAELRVRGDENATLFARALETQELADGYRFAFPAEESNVAALVQFVLAERACCPFFTFELTFPSPHENVWLAIRGREGVKEIVRDAVLSKVKMGR